MDLGGLEDLGGLDTHQSTYGNPGVLQYALYRFEGAMPAIELRLSWLSNGMKINLIGHPSIRRANESKWVSNRISPDLNGGEGNSPSYRHRPREIKKQPPNTRTGSKNARYACPAEISV